MTAHNTNGQPRAAVIGGGLAGLAAAIHLARDTDSRVTLYERASALGGRGQTQFREGFAFNLGPHAVYPGAIARLAELGIDPPGDVPNVSGLGIRGGRTHELPADFRSLMRTRLLGLRSRFEAARVIAMFPKIDPEPLMGVTVSAWLESSAKSPIVRDLLQAYLRIASYTNAPHIESAGAAIAALQSALSGVRYVDGGWATIVDALHARAAEAGVEIVTGARVEKVAVDGGRVRGVELAGGAFEAFDAVVATGSPGGVRDLLPWGAAPAVGQAAERAVPVRAACLDVALRRLPEPGNRFAVGVGEPLYYSVHSAAGRLAPGDAALVHAAKYLPPGEHGTGTERAELERMMDLLQPGWRDHVVHVRYVPSLVASNAVITAEQGGHAGRPGCDVAGIDGFAVAGDWVGPEGHLAEASLASARDAAKAVALQFRQAVAIAG